MKDETLREYVDRLEAYLVRLETALKTIAEMEVIVGYKFNKERFARAISIARTALEQ